MATPEPQQKKRKSSALKSSVVPIPNDPQLKTTNLKLKDSPVNIDAPVPLENGMKDSGPKVDNPDMAPRQQPQRKFEIDDLAKLSLLSGSHAFEVIVKVMNHALPNNENSWQYCLKADSVMPGGMGVLWVDENNLQKVNYLDITKGATVQFVKAGVILNGIVRQATLMKSDELVYEVEYACGTMVSMKDILRVTGKGVTS